jgi:3-methyladenine DNA glycosylase/8-oxoguanine DNA glycosylase
MLAARESAGKCDSDVAPFSPGAVLPPADVERIGRRWKPFRTVATWYLWRSLGTKMLGD